MMKRLLSEDPPDVGQARSIPVPDAPSPQEVILLRLQSGELRAYLNECRHLPIPLDLGSGQLLNRSKRFLQCMTHGALFRPGDGYCVTGPCRGRSLLRLPILKAADGSVEIDLSAIPAT